MINDLNWTFCYFTHDDFRAQIHQGGYFEENKVLDLFYVNIFKVESLKANQPEVDLKEVDQIEFKNLDAALEFINKNFGHWKFSNQLDDKSHDTKGGCGSCVAH